MQSPKPSHGLHRLVLAILLTLPLMTLPLPANAQGSDLTLNTAPALHGESKQATSPQQLHLEARNISMQLGKIRRQTLSENDGLQKQAASFSSRMTKEMQKNGHKPMQDRKQLMAIIEKVRGGQVKKSERGALMQRFGKIRGDLQKAQMEALQKNKSLRQEQKKLSDALLIAMKKQHPETNGLLARLQQIQQQFQAMAPVSRKP
jgi:hypothetical protein